MTELNVFHPVKQTGQGINHKLLVQKHLVKWSSILATVHSSTTTYDPIDLMQEIHFQKLMIIPSYKVTIL